MKTNFKKQVLKIALLAMLLSSFGPFQPIKQAKAVVGPCTIYDFYANPDPVVSNRTTTLFWYSEGCDAVYLRRPGDSAGAEPQVASEGSYDTPSLTYGNTYTYTLRGENMGDGSTDARSYTITVVQQATQCQITSFTGFPLSINQGQTSSLNWNSTNCSSLTLSGGTTNSSVGGNSNMTVSPTTTTTYTLSGADNQSMQVTVNVVPTASCVINNFFANPASVSPGGSTTIYWNTTNCGPSLAGPGYYHQGEPANGSKVVSNITNDQTWQLTADGGQVANLTIVVNNNCTILSFTASTFTPGSGATISWNTGSCSIITLSGGEYNNYALGSSGSITTSPLNTATTYYLNARSNINMAAQQSATASPAGGCTMNFSRTINGGNLANNGNGYSTYIDGPETKTGSSASSVTVAIGNYLVTGLESANDYYSYNADSFKLVPSGSSSVSCVTNGTTITARPPYVTAAKLKLQ